jgi:hypothetical protein
MAYGKPGEQQIWLKDSKIRQQNLLAQIEFLPNNLWLNLDENQFSVALRDRQTKFLSTIN